MPWKYIAYNKEGERVTGWVEVEQMAAAEAALGERGLIAVSLKKGIREAGIYTLLPTFFKLKTREIISFTRQLVTLLDSGLPLIQAINILHGQVRHPLLRQALEQVRRDIEDGNPLHECLEKHPNVFSSFLTRMVRVGEEAGKLQPMIGRAADHMEKQEALASRVKKALTYPIIVLIMGAASGFVLVAFAIPAMAGLLKEYGGELPLQMRILLGVGGFLSKNIGSVLLFFLLAGGLTYWFIGRPSQRRRRGLVIMRLPLIKTVLMYEAVSRFSYSLAFLLTSGLSFTEALNLLIMTTENPVISDAFHRVRAGVMSGQRFSQLLAEQKLFPSLVIQMVAVGEETGRLGDNLMLLGRFYEEETDRRLIGMTALIEPVITVVAGLGVGYMAMSTLGTLYGMMSKIK